jgi:hypothetical protein
LYPTRTHSPNWNGVIGTPREQRNLWNLVLVWIQQLKLKNSNLEEYFSNYLPKKRKMFWVNLIAFAHNFTSQNTTTRRILTIENRATIGVFPSFKMIKGGHLLTLK